VNINLVSSVLFFSADVFLEWGQVQRAKDAWSELREIAQRTKSAGLQLNSMQHDALLAALDGRLQEAVEACLRLVARGKEMEIPQKTLFDAERLGLWPRLHLGKADEALEYATPFPTLHSARALCLAHLGRNLESEQILDQQVVKRPGIGTAGDETAAYDDILYLAAAVLVGNRQVSELLMNRFAGTKVSTTGMYYTTCIARHLGGAAALLGRYNEARKHYQEAIRVTTEIRFRPELALSRLQLAELLLEHYPHEKKDALEHLDFAIKEFREMKMQPSLERALRHKDILKA
jgi:tetratricopeptide (TPR) repeat protein